MRINPSKQCKRCKKGFLFLNATGGGFFVKCGVQIVASSRKYFENLQN